MKKIIILSIFITSLITSCKKDFDVKQTQVNENVTEKFFKLPANIKPEAKKVYDYFKAENDKKEFVKNFVSKYGFIDWRFATVSQPKHSNAAARTESENESYTYVELPISSDNLDYAKGFIVSKVFDNGIIYTKIVSPEKYESLPNGVFTDGITNAEDLQMKVMILNKEFYGKSEFEILDNALFDKFLPITEQAKAATTGGRMTLTSLTRNNATPTTEGTIVVTTTITFYYVTVNCPWLNKGQLCSGQTYCDRCEQCVVRSSYQVQITQTFFFFDDDDWGDLGGGGGGGSGGGSGGGACVGCPPPTPDPCQDPNLPARTSVFKPCDQDNTGLEIDFGTSHMEGDEIEESNYDEWETKTFTAQTLPTWANYNLNYPKDANGNEMAAPDVYALAGGPLYAAHLADPLTYGNACALRTSIALDKCGITIPLIREKLSNGTYRNVTRLGANGKYYFITATDLYNWMKGTFGDPTNKVEAKDATDGEFASKLPANNGIYIMRAKNRASFGATGHASLFTGGAAVQGGHLYGSNTEVLGDIKDVSLWQLN